MKISSARLDAQSGRVDNAVLKDYAETTTGGAGGANSGTAYTIDLSTGNTFTVFLNANCTFTFTNPPTAGKALPFTILLKQDGGSRTATWPSTVIWQSGTAPTLTTTAGAYDILTFMTLDAGTSYFGFAGAATTVAAPATTTYALWAWGRSQDGQTGLGDILNRSVQTQVGTLTTWSSIAGGGRHSLVVKSDATLWADGNNATGQLGLSNVIKRSSPVQVGGMITWSSVSLGGYYSAGIKTDGTLWAWGQNTYGQLGLGDILQRSSPVQIGTLATWSSVVSDLRVLAIKTDGTLWSWGSNAFGQLGQSIAYTTHRSSPMQVGTLSTWSRIAGSNGHSHAIKTDGTLWSWGYNPNGQLGLGDQGAGVATSRSSPVQVGTLSTWSVVAAKGLNYSLALKTDGTLWSWGKNNNGQLG